MSGQRTLPVRGNISIYLKFSLVICFQINSLLHCREYRQGKKLIVIPVISRSFTP